MIFGIELLNLSLLLPYNMHRFWFIVFRQHIRPRLWLIGFHCLKYDIYCNETRKGIEWNNLGSMPECAELELSVLKALYIDRNGKSRWTLKWQQQKGEWKNAKLKSRKKRQTKLRELRIYETAIEREYAITNLRELRLLIEFLRFSMNRPFIFQAN